ncbi:ankyrin repeat-containing protein [Balamuthia mandrillaris]
MELVEAARYGELDEVKGLLNSPTPPQVNFQDERGNTALMMASANGHHDIVRTLLSAKADPNLSNRTKNTALHWAALNGHLEVLRLLVEEGNAALNVKNDLRRTALDEAVRAPEAQRSELVEYLTSKGAKMGEAVEASGSLWAQMLWS